MEKSTEKVYGSALSDEMEACSFAVESLFDVLSEMKDDDLSGHIELLAALAQHDMHVKTETILSIVEEFIGEIEIEGGLAAGEPQGKIKRIRFRPAQGLLAAMRTTISEEPDFTIGIPGGWEAYWAKKQGASSLGGNDTEAPRGPATGA